MQRGYRDNRHTTGLLHGLPITTGINQYRCRTLGDYIIPGIIGSSRPFIGQVVFLHQGTAGNIPLAAAFSVVPIVVMIFYLAVARRMGAFNAL